MIHTKNEAEELEKESKTKTSNKTKKTTAGLYVKENCVLRIVEDYGFKYDTEKKCFYNEDKTLCVDETSRLVYACNECLNLSSIAKLQEASILSIKE